MNQITKRYFSRRSFLRSTCKAGIISIMAGLIPEVLQGMTAKGKRNKINKRCPVCRVKKELYVPSPEPGVAVSLSMYYVGNGCRREEIRGLISTSDLSDNLKRRTSDDNGHTWSDWKLIAKNYPTQGEYVLIDGPNQYGTGPYDPASGRIIKPVFQRIVKGDPKVAYAEIWKGNRLFWDHGFYQLSSDNGHTWGEARQLKYEEGPDYDPRNWGNLVFLHTNEMYIGRATILKNGTVVITASVPVPFMDEEDKNAPSIFPNNYREGCVTGAMCFIGQWDPEKKDYQWKISKPVFLPRRVSTRGLDELDIAELYNGNLLMVIRGSNSGMDPLKCPGRRWYSVSHDGGHTWSEVKDMKYDTGGSFYSPASISSTIRSTVTGKLYWIGNICDVPPEGNSPRYPLWIVEMEENIPAFKKDTLTVIDDRDPAKDAATLQLSNFSVLEDCESHKVEIYLTRFGEHGGGTDTWTADACKYILDFE